MCDMYSMNWGFNGAAEGVAAGLFGIGSSFKVAVVFDADVVTAGVAVAPDADEKALSATFIVGSETVVSDHVVPLGLM